mmetsp:Transcript_114140/g.208808  ORF Transcript_114140/g.208808 Transcript_114140/m.208808 type:complete len:407 (-) Transcript_114140:121-1341(-)
MLKWQGDFTLPRFRAKLANKYLLHPDVEPGYEEVYRADLGETAINKKGFGSSLGGSSGGGFYRTMGSESLGASGRLNMSSSSLTRMPGSSSFTDLRSIGNATLRDRSDPFSSTTNLPTLSKSQSVPTIGLKRHEVAPTKRPSSLKDSMTLSDQPPLSELDYGARRERERAEAAEAASRRLWACSHGAELYIKQTLEMMKTGQGGPLNKTQVPGMKECFRKGAKIDWRSDDWDGATLLVKAVRTNALELTMYLLSMGADPMVEDYSGRGILHWAAMEGNPAMMEYLLVNVPNLQPSRDDGGGDTPLHLASYHGHMPVVRLLIRAQADPNLPNAGGFNAIQLAEARRMWHIVHYLSGQKQQQEDLAGGDAEVRVLLRPCNLLRSDELRAEEAVNPKPKPKAKADAKKK